MKFLSRKPLIFILAVIFSTLGSLPEGHGQQQKKRGNFTRVAIGFYNVENLFDTINDPQKNDDQFTIEGSYQWNAERYWEKQERLAEVIAKMGQELSPEGPVVLGLAEVENYHVLVDLARQPAIKERQYMVVHHEGPDRRSIDVALMYQPQYFNYLSSKPYYTTVGDGERVKTRDHLLVTGELLGERMHFIVAHWPSRYGGQEESAPRRMDASKVARHIVDSILAAEPRAKIMMMGDLNDDPADPSVKQGLNTVAEKKGQSNQELFNPFEPIHEQGRGTLSYRGNWNLFDQILLSHALTGNKRREFTFLEAEVFDKDFLREPSGRYQGTPFRSYGGGNYLGGYSDHFPVTIFLQRKGR